MNTAAKALGGLLVFALMGMVAAAGKFKDLATGQKRPPRMWL